MDTLQKKLGRIETNLLFGSIITGGVLVFLLGLLFLIFNRKIIKPLYYFAAAKLFFLLTIKIGAFVLIGKEDKISPRTMWITLGTALALSQVGGVLAVFFSKFGIILLGLSSGWDLWQIFSGFVTSDITNLILSVCFAITSTCICIFFKRQMETVIAAFCGATYFSFGLLYIVISIIGLTSSSSDIFSGGFATSGVIAAFIVSIILFSLSLWYHRKYISADKTEEARPFMSDV